jgi:hypothetical protein
MDHINRLIGHLRFLLISKGFSSEVLHDENEPEHFLNAMATKLQEMDVLNKDNMATRGSHHLIATNFGSLSEKIRLEFYMLYNPDLNFLDISSITAVGFNQRKYYPMGVNEQDKLPTSQQIQQYMQEVQLKHLPKPFFPPRPAVKSGLYKKK